VLLLSLQDCCCLRRNHYVEVKFRLSDCNLWVLLLYRKLPAPTKQNILDIHSLSCIISIDFSEVVALL
jgi:hypothetical protein